MAAKEPEDDRSRAPGDDAGDADQTPTEPDAEERKPLYRDEVEGDPAGPARATAGAPDEADAADRPTRVTRGSRPLSAAAARRAGDESTSILPRTQRSYAATRSDFDRLDDDEDDLPPESGRLGRRTQLALLVAGVAAVVIVGLAIGYAVLNIGSEPGAGPRPSASVPGSSSGAPGSASPDANALLSDATMLTAGQAKALDGARTWKVAVTQRGVDEESSQPACLGLDNLEGQPPSQQTVLRLLSSSGSKAPGVLHQADAYATPEEAVQAYAVSAKALGGCALPGAFIASGHVVAGLGDQAVGQVVNVTTGGKTEYHSLVLNRTGRVVNVLDVAQPGRPLAVSRVASALAAVTDAECEAAGGKCAGSPAVKDGPPPLGGDQPGFLAAADLPPVGEPDDEGSWAGTVPVLPDPDFTGSGCETVNWAKVEAEKRTSRTYLLQDQRLTFGLDNVVLTQRNPAAAAALVAKVKGDLDSCAKRKLTATVAKPRTVTSTGAGGTRVTGWAATVSQKTTEGTAKYRVGIVSAGTKVVFTFLNPQQDLDLTDAQWDTVAGRAGERASQVK